MRRSKRRTAGSSKNAAPTAERFVLAAGAGSSAGLRAAQRAWTRERPTRTRKSTWVGAKLIRRICLDQPHFVEPLGCRLHRCDFSPLRQGYGFLALAFEASSAAVAFAMSGLI